MESAVDSPRSTDTPSIAILGWGSLVWDPERRSGSLDFDGEWRPDGPHLPVEFARRARNKRITLVVLPGAGHTCPTLWTLSTLAAVEDARGNLAAREGMPGPRDVHGVTRSGELVGSPDPAAAHTVLEWLPDGVEGALWTGLPAEPTWLDPGGHLVETAVLEFAASLTGEDRERAREYVARAPAQTDTPLRARLLAALGG